MSIKSISLFVFILFFLVSFTPACATKKYVRTTVEDRISPLEGRTAELESGTRALKNQTDTLETTTKQIKEDVSNLDKRSSQGIEEAKNQATMARNDALAETSKVDKRVNTVDNRVDNLDSWEEKQLITLNFKVSQYSLNSDSKAKLDQLISEVAGKTGYILEIKGFTDTTGTLEKNLKLSQMRAQSVFQYLVENDISSFKVNLVGLGEIKPVSSNTTRVGRVENRRVEVRLFFNEGIRKNELNTIP